MTKATVENLVAKANELAQKGSWIRSGLRKWLEMWKEATSADLKDANLQLLEVWDRTAPGSNVLTYYLERGYDCVFWLWDEYFDQGIWDKANVIDIDDDDMTILRQIIRRLGAAIDKYIAELAKAGEEYDKLIMMLPPEDRDPVKLSVDYWALPRPAPEGAGWLADIIDVESEVIATTRIVATRSAAVDEARLTAGHMSAG